MKKLSLMLALVLALGVFATACSEDDEASAVTLTFKSYSTVDVGKVFQKAVFFTGSTKTFEMFQYYTASGNVRFGWRGTFTEATNVKTVTAACTNWISNGTDVTNMTWVSTKPSDITDALSTGFSFTYDGTSLATSSVLDPSYTTDATENLTKATN